MANSLFGGTDYHLFLGAKALPDLTVNLGQNSNKISIYEKSRFLQSDKLICFVCSMSVKNLSVNFTDVAINTRLLKSLTQLFIRSS